MKYRTLNERLEIICKMNEEFIKETFCTFIGKYCMGTNCAAWGHAKIFEDENMDEPPYCIFIKEKKLKIEIMEKQLNK